jgi:hypothetical protein
MVLIDAVDLHAERHGVGLAYENSVLIVWDVERNRQLLFKPLKFECYGLAFSDSRILATGGADAKVKLWRSRL